MNGKKGKNKRTINFNINGKDLHYLAGVIDSSSCFYLTKQACGRRNIQTGKRDLRWVAGFVIQNTNPNLAKTIKEIVFLGDSYTHTIDLKINGYNKRKLKGIRIHGPILDEILPKIVKILKIKKEHGEILLKFRRTVAEKYNQHNPIPIHVEKYRNDLSQRMKYINSNEYKDIAYSPTIKE